MDSHNLEPQELNDRVKLYSQRLSQLWNSIPDPSTVQQNGLFCIIKLIIINNNQYE